MKPLRQGDGLVGESFGRIPDHRGAGPDIPLRDALLSGFAMFSLKDPSLSAFDKRRSDANLKALFGIGRIPSDTRMRKILDPLDPEHPRPVFDDVFRQLQRGKATTSTTTGMGKRTCRWC